MRKRNAEVGGMAGGQAVGVAGNPSGAGVVHGRKFRSLWGVGGAALLQVTLWGSLGCNDGGNNDSPSPAESTPTPDTPPIETQTPSPQPTTPMWESNTPPGTPTLMPDTPTPQLTPVTEPPFTDSPLTDTPGTDTPTGGTPTLTSTPGTGTPGTGTPSGPTPTLAPPTPTPVPTDLDHDGYAVSDGDCNDENASIHPNAEEIPYDGIDQDCVGGDLVDVDGDTYIGEAAGGDDCDDTNQNTYPGAVEFGDGQDNDCDELVDEGLSTTDDDGDGLSEAGGDCNDSDISTYPGATEIPYDGIDQDCSGMDLIDVDGDGYIASAVEGGNDCDDTNAAAHPDGVEVCDGADNDCNGVTDEVLQAGWYQDADGDGYGNGNTQYVGCQLPPTGYVQNGADCNDGNGNINPGVADICNGVDDNCNGSVDEGSPDYDLDGTPNCIDPDADNDGVAGANGDCDDLNPAVKPGATELCNSIDDDCDGTVDQNAADAPTWYADIDEDGFGGEGSDVMACSAPEGYIADAQDCDDSSAAVNPDATEVCDGIDNNCDELIDDPGSADASTWYVDGDVDGYGSSAQSSVACSAPSGYVSSSNDCNDADVQVYPGALERCNGKDDNCDGKTDDASAWWNPAFPYRIPVTVKGSTHPVSGPPVVVDMDFDALLDTVGDGSSFRPESLRVVLPDCALNQPELPSQFLDGWQKVFGKVDDADVSGNGKGGVAFLFDKDGKYSTLETLAANEQVTFHVYFGSTQKGASIAAPTYATGLSTTANQIITGAATATFAPEQGGMLSALTTGSSPSLMSQASSCCGNSMYIGGWNLDPQDAPGTLTVLEKGPVFAAMEATGTRSNSSGAYRYSYTYWMFAGRPELWSKVYQVTTATTLSDHSGDYTSGIRPWESQQANIASGATFTIDPKGLYADTSNGTWGVAWGYAQPPKYLVSLTMYNPYLIAIGNELSAAGLGSPRTLASGTVFMDNVVQVVLPHAGSYSTISETLAGLMAGVTTSQGSAQGQP